MSRSNKHSLRGALAVVLVLVVGTAALVMIRGGFDSISTKEKQLLLQGMALHAAVRHYEEDYGQLPEHLTDLVPKYLKETNLEVPKSHNGDSMFRLVRPERPAAERRMTDDLLISTTFTSADNAGMRLVYVQEDGDVGVRKAR